MNKNVWDFIGVTPPPWNLRDEWEWDSYIGAENGHYSNVICQPVQKYKKGSKRSKPWDDNKRLIEVAPDLLEALIEMVDDYQQCNGVDDEDMGTELCREIAVIEKATEKTWAEIKELL